jgi:hypothetical protein
MQFRIAVLASVLAVGLVFSVVPATAAITHTTTNLKLAGGTWHTSSDQGDHSGGSAD